MPLPKTRPISSIWENVPLGSNNLGKVTYLDMNTKSGIWVMGYNDELKNQLIANIARQTIEHPIVKMINIDLRGNPAKDCSFAYAHTPFTADKLLSKVLGLVSYRIEQSLCPKAGIPPVIVLIDGLDKRLNNDERITKIRELGQSVGVYTIVTVSDKFIINHKQFGTHIICGEISNSDYLPLYGTSYKTHEISDTTMITSQKHETFTLFDTEILHKKWQT